MGHYYDLMTRKKDQLSSICCDISSAACRVLAIGCLLAGTDNPFETDDPEPLLSFIELLIKIVELADEADNQCNAVLSSF